MTIAQRLAAPLASALLVVACGSALPETTTPQPNASTAPQPSATAAPQTGACLGPGEGWAAFPPGNEHAECCAGLTSAEAYESAEREQRHACLLSKGGRTNCIKCGDGACGPGENFCNCPADCGK